MPTLSQNVQANYPWLSPGVVLVRFLYFAVTAHAFPNSGERCNQQQDNSEADKDGEQQLEKQHHFKILITFTNTDKKSMMEYAPVTAPSKCGCPEIFSFSLPVYVSKILNQKPSTLTIFAK
jgi:hypothetical protein